MLVAFFWYMENQYHMLSWIIIFEDDEDIILIRNVNIGAGFDLSFM